MEVFLQLLPRSSTGERMNPYTSFWTGVRRGDGPREFHLVLLDNGRTEVLADQVGRQALRCIRCSACLNVCPVYSRVGGHAYESVYPGPIGAILTPQLSGLSSGRSLPYASSLCGACYEVCPVEIDIPRVLVHLRGRVVESEPPWKPEKAAMKALYRAFASRRAFEAAQRAARLARPLARGGRIAAAAVAAVRLDATRATSPSRPRRPSASGGGASAASRATARRSHETDFAPYCVVKVRVVGRGAARSDRRRPDRRAGPHPFGAGRCAGGGGGAARLSAPERARTRRGGRGPSPSARGSTAPPCAAPRRPSWRRRSRELCARARARAGSPSRPTCRRSGARRGRAGSGHAASPAMSSTSSTAPSPAARWPSPRPARSCSTAAPRQGRRALTLVPDYHLCVVAEDAIVDLVPEAVERLGRPSRRAARSPSSRAPRPPRTSS